jgi:hypothetical protein
MDSLARVDLSTFQPALFNGVIPNNTMLTNTCRWRLLLMWTHTRFLWRAPQVRLLRRRGLRPGDLQTQRVWLLPKRIRQLGGLCWVHTLDHRVHAEGQGRRC